MPAGSICFVVQGGLSTSIAGVIALKKTPGVVTYGTSTVSVTVPWSPSPLSISYIVPTVVAISVGISLHALTNYSTIIGTEIQTAVAAYINSLGLNGTVMISRLMVPANLAGPYAAPAAPTDASTFEIVSITIAIGAGTLAASDIVVGFSSLPSSTVATIAITQV